MHSHLFASTCHSKLYLVLVCSGLCCFSILARYAPSRLATCVHRERGNEVICLHLSQQAMFVAGVLGVEVLQHLEYTVH